MSPSQGCGIRDVNRSGNNPHFLMANGDGGNMSSDKLSFCEGGGPTLNTN